MSIVVPSAGPTNAKIMVVGEAPGAEEEIKGMPFVGQSGVELDRMLHEAKIMRSECFVTNVCQIRPFGNDISQFIAKTKKEGEGHDYISLRDRRVKKPIVDGFQNLLKEIHLVRPNIIIALGNTPMWALTGRWGILKHRGSMLYAQPPFPKVKVIPTLHPAYILRDWSGRALAVHDLGRAEGYRDGKDYPVPHWAFHIRPSFQAVVDRLTHLTTQCDLGPQWIDFDLETRNGHINCAGLSWSRTEAISIPFMSAQNPQGYWSVEEETLIVHLLYKLLTHPNCWVRGQNLLFDCQYTYRRWHFIPNVKQDTMISQHVMWSGLKKSLDFQASMYCDYYVQWKPDKVAWAEGK